MMPDRKNGVAGSTSQAPSHPLRPSSRSGRPSSHSKAVATTTNDSVDESKNIRVSLRLRPMNKLEQSRRSRNCVEVHPPGLYGTTELTVDSPLEGEYDFNFDQVFESDASQAAVYAHAGAPFAKKLIGGFNCAIIVYGQSGSGKTYTMLGNQYSKNGSKYTVDHPEFSQKSISNNESNKEENKRSDRDIEERTKEEIDEHSGIIPRILNNIFDVMDDSPANIEFTVRVSYIEIYLEQIRDLLNPSNHFLKIADSSPLSNGRPTQNNKIKKTLEPNHIEGLSELCCIDESDVLSLLARGNAYRVISDQKNQTDLKQSHAIFILKIEQKDTITKKSMISKLFLVDMAGSEADGKGKPSLKKGKPGSAVYQLETKIINRAHSAMGNVLKALADNMQKQKTQKLPSPSLPKNVPYRESKLTRILRDAFGLNCFTTFVLTASPATFNISATIATMRFGQKCRRIENNPMVNVVSAPEEFNLELEILKRRESELVLLVQTLAVECEWIKTEITNDVKSAVKPSPEAILDRLGDILRRNKYLFAPNGSITKYNKSDSSSSPREALIRKEEEMSSLKIQLEEIKKARDRVHNLMLEIQAECAVLRTESEAVLAAKKRNTLDLIDAQNEIQDLCQRKLEVEHNLRTSQFRETEAIVFLRHFRRFYKKLLQTKTAEGSGNMSDIITKFGVPDNSDMIGLDNFLVAAGIIETEEVDNDQKSGPYRPSVPALLRSSSGAKQAQILAESLFPSLIDDELTSMQQQKRKNSRESVKFSEVEDGLRSNSGKSVESNRTKSTNSVTRTTGNDAIHESKLMKIETFPRTIEHSNKSSVPSSISDGGRSSSRNLAERQMKLHTPAGMATKMRQEQLEDDLAQMSRICIELQIALNEEREYNEILSNRQGARAKRRMAEEAISARRELSKKTNDLQAVVWKMNELHLINKTYEEKVASREQHVYYLEESLATLNQKGIEVASQHNAAEGKFRKEIDQLQSLLNTMTKPLWQYGEGGKRTLESRMIIPIQGGNRDIVDDATLLSQTGQGEKQEISGPSMDTSKSSERTTNSIDMRVGSPQIYPISGRSKAKTYYDFVTQTDSSEAGLSWGTPAQSSIESSIFVDKLNASLRHSEMIEDEFRPGTRDGIISLDPLVEEMTLTSKDRKSNSISDEVSEDTDNLMIGVGAEQIPPKPIPFPGHTNDFIPRRFSKKFGPLIKAGVLKPNKRLRENRHEESYFRQASRESIASSLSSPTVEVKSNNILAV